MNGALKHRRPWSAKSNHAKNQGRRQQNSTGIVDTEHHRLTCDQSDADNGWNGEANPRAVNGAELIAEERARMRVVEKGTKSRTVCRLCSQIARASLMVDGKVFLNAVSGAKRISRRPAALLQFPAV